MTKKNIKSSATEDLSQDPNYQRNLAIIRSLKKRTDDGELKWRDTNYDTGNGFVITEIDTEAAGKITLELGPRNEYYGPDDIGFDLFVSVGSAASQEISAEYHKHLELYVQMSALLDSARATIEVEHGDPLEEAQRKAKEEAEALERGLNEIIVAVSLAH